jgi:hypothetical protein
LIGLRYDVGKINLKKELVCNNMNMKEDCKLNGKERGRIASVFWRNCILGSLLLASSFIWRVTNENEFD